MEGLEADEALDTETLTAPTVEILEELMEQLSGEEKWLLHLKYWQGWFDQRHSTSYAAIRECRKVTFI